MVSSSSLKSDRLISIAIAGISVTIGILQITSLIAGLLTVGDASLFYFGLLCVFSFLQILFIILSIPYFVIKYKSGVGRAALPFVINILLLAITILLWYEILPQFELGFRYRISGYIEVVEIVQSGQIKPNQNGDATLPPEYQYLSETGQIRIYNQDGVLSIVFYNSMGILGEYTAYVYRSNNVAPTLFDIGCDWAWPVKTGTPNWFYCDSQ